MAERWLPQEAAWRTKKMFQAPFDVLCAEPVPSFVEQLLSAEALERTGYFDAAAVRHWRGVLPGLRPQSVRRVALELALGGVVATQLWHQTFLGGGLADLPASFRSASRSPSLVAPRLQGV